MNQENNYFAQLGVCQELCEACNRLEFINPTKIQQEALPQSLKGKDIIGLAETGSGKTLAFSIPMLQSLLEKPQVLFGLILAPTRELCLGIQQQIDALGVEISLRTVLIVGGLDIVKQAIALQKQPQPHILIATPGRLLYHLQNTPGFHLKTLKYLVLDEADKLLNMDFEKDINIILEHLPQNRQTMLFSATMTNKVNKLQRVSLSHPVKIQVSQKYQTVEKLDQKYLFIPENDKEVYLVYILTELNGNQIIIFLTFLIRNLGFNSASLNGKMSEEKRIGSLNKFKKGERNILIATDVATRGLDIPDIDMVINYDMPQNPKDYVHRVGRTARAGKAGRALTFVSQYGVEQYQKIEYMIDKKLELFKADEREVYLFKERVQEAKYIAEQELKTLLEKKLHHDSEEEDALTKKKQNKRIFKNNKFNRKKNTLRNIQKLDF